MGKVVGSSAYRRVAPVRRGASLVVSAASGLAFGVGLLGSTAAPTEPAQASPIGLPALVPSATPAREWRLVAGKHWQIVSSNVEDQATTDRAEGTRGSCPAGMVEVKGRMKLDPPTPRVRGEAYSIEEMQKTACTRWVSRDFPERCGEFDRDRWLALTRDLPTKPMSFCIDRFEYPNLKGQFPIILVNWNEARDVCAAGGKRLCSETEWTFACEGEEAAPYPNGYVRDPEACVNDQPWRPFDEHAYTPRDGPAVMRELDRLWQGQPSGARPKCRSPFGVYDLTGNVDEWTRSSREGERPSILKGGYWGPVRTRCRPSTRSHDEAFMFYQQGVRCCADAPSDAKR